MPDIPDIITRDPREVELEQLQLHPKVVEKIDATIKRTNEKLLTATDYGSMRNHQGAIEALNLVKKFPEQIVNDEIEKRRKERVAESRAASARR